MRPLDAYAALKPLRGRRNVNPEAIGVQGWSNGAMTVLVTMGSNPPGLAEPSPSSGFRAALAEYPGCGMDAIKEDYRNYAPLVMMLGSADEEVSPERCQKWAAKAKKSGSEIQVILYEGAEHNFDDPSTKSRLIRQIIKPPRRRCGEPRASFLNICSIKRSRYTPKMHVEP